ncbi:DUF397 domain-containing protein [Streptomyces sp. ID05-39B]|uniref:DUF397 domain-containing protein n=1 Tax=Streptomyces sp. ID05-39B TaxID=3028664 RepID=UPI0029B3722A|nr:DUF397 domain-containing protein [Streptomyces sp. ID05-39B]
MTPPSWQKSSYCQEGDACVHISASPATIHLTESAHADVDVVDTRAGHAARRHRRVRRVPGG